MLSYFGGRISKQSRYGRRTTVPGLVLWLELFALAIVGVTSSAEAEAPVAPRPTLAVAASAAGAALPRPVADDAATETVIKRVSLPVAWQLTRTGTQMGSGSLTQTFHESWTLEITGTRLYVESPRARIEVFAGGQSAAGPRRPLDVPVSLVIPERDFGRLVGITWRDEQEPADPQPSEAGDAIDRPVSLPLVHQGRELTEISLTWSDDVHYAVQIDVGATALF